jgi:hypothetical protein
MQEHTSNQLLATSRDHKRSPQSNNFKNKTMKSTLLLAATGLALMTGSFAKAQLPDIITKNGMVIRCESFVGNNERKSKHDPQLGKYDATSGYVIVSYGTNVVTDIGITTWQLSNVQGNSNTISSQQLASSYQYAYSYLASLNIPSVVKAAAAVDLNGSWSFNQSTLNQLQSSNPGIILQTDAHGAGIGTFKGRNHIVVELIDVKEMRIPVCFCSQAAMQARLKSDVDAAYAKWKKTQKWYTVMSASAAHLFSWTASGLNRPIGSATLQRVAQIVKANGDPGFMALPPNTVHRSFSPAPGSKTSGTRQVPGIEVELLSVTEAEARRTEILTSKPGID